MDILDSVVWEGVYGLFFTGFAMEFIKYIPNTLNVYQIHEYIVFEVYSR